MSKQWRQWGGKRAQRIARLTLCQARRLIIAVVGTTVVLIGLVLLVTPGPAFIVIPLGIAILAVEFAWARRLLHRLGRSGTAAKDRMSNWWRKKA